MKGKNLFELLPDQFFNLLSSKSNKDLYAGCLMEIYRLYDREISYRMDRETVRQAAYDYIVEDHSIRLQEDVAAPKDLANLVLNRMLHAGWLEEETDTTTYIKYISLTEQGLGLAEFMRQTIHPEKEEYAAYIYQIYNSLKHKDQWRDHPYAQGLKLVHRNARHLSVALKKLSTFMRTIIERMLGEQSLESLTENLLEYCQGEFIREYSRLTRQQNIHLYRTAIREDLEKIYRDQAFYQRMVSDCMEEESLPKSKAEEILSQLLSSTKRFLTEDYDQLMYEIKQKLNAYINLAVGRARFLMNHEESMRGNVEETVKDLICQVHKEGDGQVPEELSQAFRLQTFAYIDPYSIRFPRKTREVTDQVEVRVEPLTEASIEAAKEKIAGEARNPYSRDKMKAYIRQLMGEKKGISGDQMPLESDKDLLSLLSALVYAGQNGYEVEIAEDSYIRTDKLSVRNFALCRKENFHDH